MSARRLPRARRSVGEVARRLHIPSRHKVEQACVLHATKRNGYVRTLRLTHEFGAHKRRIPNHVVTQLRQQHRSPLGAQGVGTHDVGASHQRQAVEIATQHPTGAQVLLVVGEPQGHGRDLRGAGLDLNAVELVHIALDVAKLFHVQRGADRAVAALDGLQGFHRVQLQPADLAVGDHQKVAAAACRVEAVDAAQPLQQLLQSLCTAAGAARRQQFGFECIQKQGANHPQDIGLAGVVRAQLAPLGAFAGDAFVVVVNHGLKQRAKNGRADLRPIKVLGAMQQHAARCAVEVAAGELAVKHAAVHIGETGQLCRQIFGTLGRCMAEHVKQVLQRAVEVATVLARLLAQVAAEAAGALENAGVFGKQAKQQPHQITLQVHAGVAAVAHGVVQLRNIACGVLVHCNLRLLRLRLVARQKQVSIQVLRKVGQRVAQRGCDAVEAVQTHVLKVADQKVLGQLHVAQAGQVVGGLLVGLIQVFATRFHFNQKLARIKAVDAATPSTELFDALLKTDQALVRKPKDIAQTTDEVLRFAELVLCVRKVFGEVVCAMKNFSVVERDGHPEILFAISE